MTPQPEHGGATQRPPQLIALSGGKDSTGLAVWLCTHHPEEDYRLVHVRHGLRNDAPDAQAARATAAMLNRPFIEVPAAWQSVHRAGGPEDAARQARYAAFAQVASTLGAHVVYVAHTADDQAETILLRLVRGTGPSGMAGMAATTHQGGLEIRRPLLGYTREAVHRFAEGYPTVNDPTNTDLTQRRAFVRHEIIPRLAHARPDRQAATAAIVSYAQLQAEQNELLEHLTAPYVGPSWGFVHRVPDKPDHPPLLVRYLIHHAMGYDVTRTWVERIFELPVGGVVDLPANRWASRDHFGWLIGRNIDEWSLKKCEPMEQISATHRKDVDPISHYPMPWKLPIYKDIHLEELMVRLRLPRDKPLKAIFNKFPKSLRKQLPVLYTGDNGAVVAIGPISLHQHDLHPGDAQWVQLSPSELA